MLRRFLGLFFVLECTATSTAQLPTSSSNFTLSTTHFADTIPVDFDNGLLLVPVEIEGRTYRYILDTGAAQGMLNVPSPIPQKSCLGNVITRDANDNADTLKAIVMPPMKLGKITIDGYVALMGKKIIGKGNCDGILGFDLINQGISMKIDVRRRQLILTDRSDFFEGEKGERLKYHLKWFVPHVYVSPFKRHVDEVCFDTGCQQLYEMNVDAFRVHAYRSRQVNAQVEGRATGYFSPADNSRQTAEVFFLHLNRLKWNDFALTDVHCTTTQGSSRVGAQLLKYGSVIFNQRQKTVTFQPYDGQDSVNVGNRQLGVAFIPRDGRPEIGIIWHKSEAFRNGMRQGDTVLSINGTAVPNFQWFANYRFKDGQRYVFRLRDSKGREKEVSLTR